EATSEGAKKEKQTAPKTTDTLETQEAEVETDSDFEFIPPSTIQIASIFKKAGLTYDASILNDPSKVNTYIDKFSQSLNFGVYSSDLSVCVLNDQAEAAKEYLMVVKELSGKIGLQTVLNDASVIDRFNNNLNNQDSIVEILFYVHENTEEYISQNGQDDLAVIYYTGAWIEGMYFGALKAKENPTNAELSYLITEQISIARTMQKGLLNLETKTDDTDDLAVTIGELISIYDNFDTIIALGDDAEYLDVQLTELEINTLSDVIIELRNTITG
ncbi:MAG: hypothetical protein ACI8Q1_001717, partial [Parvicella sp.]